MDLPCNVITIFHPGVSLILISHILNNGGTCVLEPPKFHSTKFIVWNYRFWTSHRPSSIHTLFRQPFFVCPCGYIIRAVRKGGERILLIGWNHGDCVMCQVLIRAPFARRAREGEKKETNVLLSSLYIYTAGKLIRFGVRAEARSSHHQSSVPIFSLRTRRWLIIIRKKIHRVQEPS